MSRRTTRWIAPPVVAAGVLGLVCAAGAALASGQGSYGALFPANPCQDGWVACVVDGRAVDPTPNTDERGRPLPSDARLGWFDLEPTLALSPFSGLSDYDVDGALPPRASDAAVTASADKAHVAEAIARIEAERQAIVQERQDEQERMQVQQESAKKAQEDAEALAREQEARRQEEAAARAQREQEEAAALAEARTRSAEEAARLEADQRAAREKAEAERVARERVEAEARAAADAEAKAQAEQLAKEQADAAAREAEREAREAAAAAAEEEAAAAAAQAEAAAAAAEEEAAAQAQAEAAAKAEKLARQAEEDKSCDDLVSLEPAALMGRLREGQVGCLEGRYAAAGSQTDKDKISRVLMVNAETSGDRAEWERLIQRHLTEVDRSDPDLCFSYALYLSKGGPARAWAVIEWSDNALENKSRWTGSTYKARVYNLMQLKAEAAAALWEASAQAVVAGQGDRAALQENEKKLRGMAKDYAREWLDYARASGQEDRKAMALCVSAAGSKKFCEG